MNMYVNLNIRHLKLDSKVLPKDSGVGETGEHIPNWPLAFSLLTRVDLSLCVLSLFWLTFPQKSKQFIVWF